MSVCPPGNMRRGHRRQVPRPAAGGLRRDTWQPAEPARLTPRCPSTALQRNRPGGGRSGEQGEGTGAADAPEPEDEVDRTRAPAPSAGSSSPQQIPGPAPQTRWSWRTSLSTGQARHGGRRPSGRCPQTPPGRRKRAPSSASSGGASSAATSRHTLAARRFPSSSRSTAPCDHTIYFLLENMRDGSPMRSSGVIILHAAAPIPAVADAVLAS